MKEVNRTNLQRAIQELPTYEPPEGIWQHISGELDREASERPLREAIGQLRTYQPPGFVWEGIEKSLSEPVPAPGKIRPLYPRIAAAAAAVLLILAAVRFWPEQTDRPQVVYTVEETSTPAPMLVADWDADEDLISDLIDRFDSSPKAAHSAGYESLKEELEELNEAKEELEMIMQKYGQDAGTVEQLKEIELERTDVIKEMAALI